MRLVSIDEGEHGACGALLADGQILHLRRAARRDGIEAWLPGTMRELLAAGPDGLAVVAEVIARAAHPGERARLRELGALLPPHARLLAPVPRPGLVVAAGLAYRSHLAEMAGTPAPPYPTAFMKSPHSIAAPGSAVDLPAAHAECVDYEGELAVVFGRRCHGVGRDEALDYVAGYTLANDMSARDWVRDVWSAKTPWEARLTWEVNLMGKQFDGFTPCGPALLTADEVPDLGALHLATRLNGRLMQSAPLSDLIFDLPATISHLSRWYTFEPGDMLLTGTPAGVGVGREPPVFMREGDVVEVEVERIGVLRNTIARARPGQ